jgi:hypothetical protein
MGLQYVAVLSIALIYAVVVAEAAGQTLDQEINLVSLGMIGAACGGFLQARKSGPIGSGFLVIPRRCGCAASSGGAGRGLPVPASATGMRRSA